ncbi:MAG: methyl-accepting chemotaxis protein [Candidatus Latescibacterota bacterium]|nr:MAG: methyl-accepting chemotaxis protein [Candidatus Latescibacterota bacterium]
MRMELIDQPLLTPREPSAAPAPRPARLKQALWRRRFGVHWRSQLPITLLVAGVTLFSLVMLNLALFDVTAARREAILELAPAAAEQLLREDQRFHLFVHGASALLLVVVTTTTLTLTNRTVGPIWRVESHLDRIAQGDLNHTIEMRRRDYFRSLAARCNELIGALRHDAAREIEILERVADRVERHGLDGELTVAVTELRGLVADKQNALAGGTPRRV